MKIQAITPFVFNNKLKNNPQKQNNIQSQNYAYNPIAYNDLTFTARLFRTPENFYEQPFNKNGMPETMKQYLNADYEDRQKMPPEQMLKLVFDDINETKNLEQVKRIFPDEPLFKNLTDTPSLKSRTGILAEIDLMREEGKTLFKNGKDNLGHYILKKIYTEGKTLKEINKDFSRDVSIHYNGLSPIEYSTLKAFGIKFPDNAFWKSFTANRESFPYTYTPRKPIEHRTSAPTKTDKPRIAPALKNRFANVKDWEIDKLADALTKGNGNAIETKKRLKNSSVRDDATLNFVAKYMSEINSVVLEKLHVSPEMREFFDDPEHLSKSQKQKLDAYWQSPEVRDQRSKVMSYVIKFFFEVYGADGQNDEFKELIDYAHSIKDNRLTEFEKHQRIQAEYDEMAARLDAEEAEAKAVLDKELEAVGLAEKQLDELSGMLDKLNAQYNTNQYRFKTDNGDDLVFVGNLKEALEESLRNEYSILPKPFLNKVIKFITTHDKLSDSYILSRLITSNRYNIPETDQFMTVDEMNQISLEINEEFYKNNKLECRAIQQALVDAITDNYSPKSAVALLSTNPLQFINLANSASDFDSIFDVKKDVINAKYMEYRKPLTSAESSKLANNIINIWRKTTETNSPMLAECTESPISNILLSVAEKLKTGDKRFINTTKNILTQYINSYGGNLRVLLDRNLDNKYAAAKFESFLADMYSESTNTLYQLGMIASIS